MIAISGTTAIVGALGDDDSLPRCSDAVLWADELALRACDVAEAENRD